MSSKDIIRATIDCLMSIDPRITTETGLVAERRMKAEWGGQRIEYVPRTCEGERSAGRRPIPLSVLRVAYRDALNSRESTERIAERHGISRASLCRLVKSGLPPESGGET